MYTLILRKGKIELELTTDDKETIEEQLSLVIRGASNLINNNIAAKPEESVPEEFIQKDEKQEEQDNETPYIVQNIAEESFQVPNDNSINATENNPPKIIETEMSITPRNPVTINSLQNKEEHKEPNFDDILNTEMKHDTSSAPIAKDEKFVNYVESKSAIEKLDFLVIAAQYLAQYENMNTFNLKHINAKLMQNFTLIVDHSVLQNAISREYITRIQEGSDDTTSEYMLTEKGLRSY